MIRETIIILKGDNGIRWEYENTGPFPSPVELIMKECRIKELIFTNVKESVKYYQD